MTTDLLARTPGDPPPGDVGAPAAYGSWSSVIRRSAAGVVLAVVVLVGIVAFGSDFANFDNFANIAASSSFLAIVAIGMTFVIIGGGIDLSVGSMYALAAVLAAYSSQWGSWAGVVVPILVCGAIGSVQGVLIGRVGLPPFIITLAGLLFARGLAFKVSDNGNTTYLIDSGRWIRHLGQGRIIGIGVPVWIALVVVRGRNGGAQPDAVRTGRVRGRRFRGRRER